MSKTVKVAQTSDLSPGTGKVVQSDGHTIALFNVEGTFFAIDNTCFNVKTGAVTRPPAPTAVASFPVKVEGNDVLVEVD
jgi:nitrite reductase/ring-hydroxylating ferredoxin subunit